MNGTIIIGGAAILLLWGGFGFAAKIAIERIGLQNLIWSQIVSLVMFPTYFVLFKDMLPLKLDGTGIAWAIAAGACGLGGGVVLNVLLRSAPASVVVPISALYPVVTVTLAYFFLNEQLSFTRLIGIGCAVLAIWLLTA